MSGQGKRVRHFYRLRTRHGGSGRVTVNGLAGTAVSVRVEPDRPDGLVVYLAVGAGRRRMYLTGEEAWTLWRCLSEAVNSLGDPPDHIRTHVPPAPR